MRNAENNSDGECVKIRGSNMKGISKKKAEKKNPYKETTLLLFAYFLCVTLFHVSYNHLSSSSESSFPFIPLFESLRDNNLFDKGQFKSCIITEHRHSFLDD